MMQAHQLHRRVLLITQSIRPSIYLSRQSINEHDGMVCIEVNMDVMEIDALKTTRNSHEKIWECDHSASYIP